MFLQAKNYQSTILKLSKQIDDYDVTNGELKEEVETLEVNIDLLFLLIIDIHTYILYTHISISFIIILFFIYFIRIFLFLYLLKYRLNYIHYIDVFIQCYYIFVFIQFMSNLIN